MLTTSIIRCNDEEPILEFLRLNSNFFTPPLASRVDITEYSKKLANKATNIFLHAGENVVGHAAIYQDDPYKSFLSSFCVNYTYQHMGLGKTLMDAVFEDCSLLRHQQIELKVASQNTIAYAFYLRCGFLPRQERNNEIAMVKYLS